MSTIIVAQGMCSPIRPQVLTALAPYGFAEGHAGYQVISYSMGPGGQRGRDGAGMVGDDTVLCNVAEITVSDARAAWTEYLLLRAGKFQLMSKPIEPRNQRWAMRWDSMPRSWTQPGCTAKTPDAKPAPARRGIGSLLADMWRQPRTAPEQRRPRRR